MFDPLTLVAGGVLITAGYLTGRRGRRAPKTPELVYSCGHGYGTHEPNGTCRCAIERTRYGRGRAVLGTEWVPCACMAYDGPEPLPRVWTPGGTP